MHDQQEKIIEELKTALLALPTEDKKSILTALDAPGATVPENCQPYITAINELAAIADVAIFREALTMPQQIEIQEPGEDVISKTLQLLRDIPQEEKNKLTLGLVDREQINHFDDTLHLYLLWIIAVITKDKRFLSDVADIFGLRKQDIEWMLEAATEQETALIVDDEDEYLPGLSPKSFPAYTPAPKFELLLSKAAREMARVKLEKGENGFSAVFTVSKDKKAKVFLEFPQCTNGQNPFEEYDALIITALGNLYQERQQRAEYRGVSGGSIITPSDIIRFIRRYDASIKIRDEEIEKMAERVEYLKNLKCKGYFQEHYNMVNKKAGSQDFITQVEEDTELIHAITRRCTFSSGKRAIISWELLREPSIYYYSKAVKQFATLDSALLNIRKPTLRNSRDSDILRIKLLERISYMISPRTHKPKGPECAKTIDIEKILAEAGIDIYKQTANGEREVNRELKSKKTKLITTILDHFKETPNTYRGTFIKGYNILKRGKSISGIEIVF